MLSKIKQITLLLLLTCSMFWTSAQNDTVYVYEDMIVYDIIVVYDTVFTEYNINNILPLKSKSTGILQIDTISSKANLLLISNKLTATFSIDDIILNENFNKNIKNLGSMKNLSFFGVVFFAFQTMVIAQTNYEVSVGTGMWWGSGKIEYVDKPYSPLFSVGFFAKRNFKDKNFGLKTGIEYSYLLGGNDYKFDGTIGVWSSEEDFETINSHYSAGQHNISVPILIYFDKYKVQPFVGFNYNYLSIGNQIKEFGGEYFNSFADSHNIGLNCGVYYKINGSFYINMEYKYNLTSDFLKQDMQGENCFNDGRNMVSINNNLRNSQVKLSVAYSLNKRK